MKNIARLRQRFILTMALIALLAERGLGQTLVADPPIATIATPVAVADPVPYSWPSPTKTNPYPTRGLPYCGSPGACAANEDTNGWLLKGDPLLDWSCWVGGRGFFGVLEVDSVGPFVSNHLNAPVTVRGLATTVQLPSAALDWTTMPHVELGYRLGQAAGELSLSYRGIFASGADTIAGIGARKTASLVSRLNMNICDIDYASRENSLGPLWDMKWRSGVRIATVFFDSDAATPLLTAHESNNFVGAGLHFGLNLKRRLGETGFSLMGQADGGAVLGHIHQLYQETITGVGSGSTTATANEPAPVLEVRMGLEFSPHVLPNLHLATGYLFERWWTVGETNGTNGDVTYQGIFWRAEWRF